MTGSRHIDKICAVAITLAVLLTILFMNGEALGIEKATASPPYIERLFDDSYVHTIDLVVEPEDWRGLLAHADEKEYVDCTAVIDGEAFEHIGLRAKGNNSLAQTSKYGSDRYSLKLEFDHYSKNQYYYGLDKLSLNAAFQDNSFLKEYMTFDMMRFMDVKTPLCSYAYVTVNGKDWGLFVAIEEVEEAFVRRNFGSNHGLLYKPDYKNLGDQNDDVALIYTDDDFESYDNIFRNAKFDIDDEDKARLIKSLKQLSTDSDLESVVDIDQMLRYFTVQSFVVNLDSYLGRTGHNYFLYEEDGVLSMIPWDYNLAYATYMLGIEEPVNDSTMFVNYPIDTPAPGEYMLRRPMFHNLMMKQQNFDQYHRYYDTLITEYFESGHFGQKTEAIADMIAPYVQKDPTKFCSYEDHRLAVEIFRNFCALRAQSVRGQLNGDIPASFKGQAQDSSTFIDASSVWIPDLGDFDDMRRIRDEKEKKE